MRKEDVIRRAKDKGFTHCSTVDKGQAGTVEVFEDECHIMLEVDCEKDEFRFVWAVPRSVAAVILPSNGGFCSPFSGGRQFDTIYDMMLNVLRRFYGMIV